MADFTAADVKRLREMTGAGMMDCKRALEESQGDTARAIEILRVKGAKDVGKRAERVAANGLVISRLLGTEAGLLLELNCETDFVAKTEAFGRLADQVAEVAIHIRPADTGALLAAEVEPGTTVSALLDEANATMGEKIEVRQLAFFDDGYVASYLHKSDPGLPPTTGVLVELDVADAQLAKDVAQQIAAMAPRYISREQVPDEVLVSERRIAEEAARAEGKPEAALARIIEGRLAGFYKDAVLVDQAFVKDNKRTVADRLGDRGATVRRFARLQIRDRCGSVRVG
ncbi:MAG: translation elongation factor Ts [Actinomycetes bacterium]